jgi:hypothetical protein
VHLLIAALFRMVIGVVISFFVGVAFTSMTDSASAGLIAGFAAFDIMLLHFIFLALPRPKQRGLEILAFLAGLGTVLCLFLAGVAIIGLIGALLSFFLLLGVAFALVLYAALP